MKRQPRSSPHIRSFLKPGRRILRSGKSRDEGVRERGGSDLNIVKKLNCYTTGISISYVPAKPYDCMAIVVPV